MHPPLLKPGALLLASCITLTFLSLPALAQDGPSPANAESENQTKMLKSLGAFGFGLGGLVTKLAEDSKERSDISPDDSQQALKQLVAGYKLSRDGGLGTVGLLNATFDTALTGIDIATGGSSELAMMGVRWVKQQALDSLAAKIKTDAGKSLAAGIDDLVQKQGLDYDTLSNEAQNGDVDQVKEKLDQVPAFIEMEKKLADDPAGQQILEHAAIDLLANTTKAELDSDAQNQQDIATTQQQLTDLAHSVSQYMDDTNKTLTGLTSGLDMANQSISEAQMAISSLAKQTDANSQDISRIENFMFGQATAQQRKLMLDGGFMSDLQESSPEAFNALKEETDAAAQREQLVSQMNHMVQQFDDIGQIAKNLGIDIPGLPEALAVANTADTVISDVVGGDYLGAIVGITGLFGSHTDPLQAFKQQLFGYLDGQFKKIDETLNKILAGQQQIMSGLAELSNQMAVYDKGVQDHLDRIEFKIDRIDETALESFYWPLASCQTLKQSIIDRFGKLPDLTNFDQAYGAATQDVGGMAVYCINYLLSLYGVAFDPTSFGFDPLALRYFRNAAPTDVFAVKTDPQMVNQYVDLVKIFLENQYRPTLDFVNAARSKANPFELGANLPNGMALTSVIGAGALPARNVSDYKTKMAAFGRDADACAKGTVLSEPLVNVLCRDPNAPDSPTLTLRTLKPSGFQPMEDYAQQKASAIMGDPLVGDQLVDLAKWAEFFAPIFDYTDPATKTVFADFDKFISQPVLGGRGERLIRGALQTLTFGVAQGDMLYGDVTAGLIFQTLWADLLGFLPTLDDHVVFDKDGHAALAPGGSDLQKQAIALLQNNPYLQSNVLMLALDSASLVSGDGQELAYEQALDFFIDSDVEPESQLNALFQGEIKFKPVWRPMKTFDDSASAEAAEKSCESTHDTTQCVKSPAATFLGIDVPLPPPDNFAQRAFVYPRFLLEMLGTRDRMAAHLADYEAFNSAIGTDNDAAKRASAIAKTVTVAYQ
jgi:hypothetical protein